ncbi:hypothetical protein HJD18_10420 [Thermoleophilia bacterium SCSIO 60948]|nr:hypothetical protein HJD18_10420 [Thermoleophilia bacterium SCSIO 60948]
MSDIPPQLPSRIAALEKKVSDLYRRLGVPEPSLAELAGEIPAEVVELAQAGNQIGAIKLLHEMTGCGLAEAREKVQTLT